MTEKKVRGARRGIHRRNLIYWNIYPYTKAFFWSFYGKVEVKGLENIPRGEPVILAPNHQNALMDALIVLFSAPQDVVFLARADIFSNKAMAFFFNSLKILPVFRQRDGAAELGKNEQVFEVSVDVLKNRHYLAVMPEGNHGNQRKLRALVKGIFRIAIAAQEDAGEKPFVKIVPVGLDFGDYVKQNASLFINYGKPIEISDYWAQLEENKPRAINAMKKDLMGEMHKQMIHISNTEYYEPIQEARKIFNPRMREILEIKGDKLSDQFVADKEMIARLEATMAAADAEKQKTIRNWADNVATYIKGLEEMNIRDWVVRKGGICPGKTFLRFLGLLLTFPFFLFGALTSSLPFFLPQRMVRGIKDIQFHSSVKAGLGILVIFPLTYVIMTLIVGLVFKTWWIWLGFLILLYPMGILALKWSFWWKKTVRGSWFAGRLRRKYAKAVELTELRKQIMEQTEALL